MKILSTFCILSILFFSACEDPDPVFPEEIVLACQEDVDEIAPLLLQGVFDQLDPGAAFRGSLRIESGSCGSPITDLSFFSEYRFWLGTLVISSDDITNLDFLSTIEQFRNGFSIVNCSNLTSISLPACAEIEGFFDVINNPVLTEIQIGQNHDEEIYEEIDIDSMSMLSNPTLTAWRPGLTRVNFGRAALLKENPLLTDLTALSDLSLPSNVLDFDLYGVTVNESGENPAMDSINMPFNTFIEAMRPNNDYTWLSMAKITPRFNDDGVDVGRIENFRISGEVTVPELCPIASVADTLSLSIVSTAYAGMMEITTERLEDECPE